MINPCILSKFMELDPYSNPEFCRLDDLGTSKLFVEVYKGKILFNKTADSWFVYNGIKWEEDQGDLKVDDYAKEFAETYKQYMEDTANNMQLMQIPAEQREIARKKLEKYCRYIVSLGKRSQRKTIIEDARSYNPVSYEEFDVQPHLFNCQNGVIDLMSGELLPHSPELMLSKVANVVYDPQAKCERFDSFMDEIMCGDAEKVKYLQTLFGYTLGGTNEREEAYFLYGKTTRNGKSTLLDTIKYLFGDYGMNIQPESLADQKKSGRAASGDIARLDGCRLLQMAEPPKSMNLDVALLKTLTGRDEITARYLYENDFEFKPIFKLFVNTNYLPLVSDNSLFASERVKVITFDRHFESDEQDLGLKDALISPESLSGILNWILQGNKRYRENHGVIEMPNSVIIETENYRKHSDKLEVFLTDFAAENVADLYACSILYDKYVEWCKANNRFQDGKHSFLSGIRKKEGYQQTGTINGKTVKNVFHFEPSD